MKIFETPVHAESAQPEIDSTHPIASTRTEDHDAGAVGETICEQRKANSPHSTRVINEPVMHRANLNNTNHQTINSLESVEKSINSKATGHPADKSNKRAGSTN